MYYKEDCLRDNNVFSAHTYPAQKEIIIAGKQRFFIIRRYSCSTIVPYKSQGVHQFQGELSTFRFVLTEKISDSTFELFGGDKSKDYI